jgi:formylglycine-generating enzyme required for sulfatase activity
VYHIGAGIEVEDPDHDNDEDYPQVTADDTADGFRLPTEAEWECAARAGTAHRYPGGDAPHEVGWFDDGVYAENGDELTPSSVTSIQPVGQKRPNAWGLYDMAGNIEEWCWDRYEPYVAGARVDPRGPARAMQFGNHCRGAKRIERGGAYYQLPRLVWARFGRSPGYRGGGSGLRLARTLPL